MKRIIAIIISGLVVFALAACGSGQQAQQQVTTLAAEIETVSMEQPDEPEEVKTEEAEPAPAMVGGWELHTQESYPQLPEEVSAAFEKATQEYVGMGFQPVAYLAEQVVAGMNYQILCLGTVVTATPVTEFKVVTVYANLEGGATVSNVADFDLAELEEREDAQAQTEQLAGGWTVPEDVEAGSLPEDAATAFSAAIGTLMGVDYTPEVLLGTKVIAGIEYAILCQAKTVTENPVSYQAVMFIAANADGTYDLMKVVPLDQAEYNK